MREVNQVQVDGIFCYMPLLFIRVLHFVLPRHDLIYHRHSPAQELTHKLHVMLSFLDMCHMTGFLECEPFDFWDILEEWYNAVVLGLIKTSVKDKSASINFM